MVFFLLFYLIYDGGIEKIEIERERERQHVPNYTRKKGRTNERVCCLDRIHSDDKSNSCYMCVCFFSSFKKREFGKEKKVATKKRENHGTVKLIVLIYALNELTKF